MRVYSARKSSANVIQGRIRCDAQSVGPLHERVRVRGSAGSSRRRRQCSWLPKTVRRISPTTIGCVQMPISATSEIVRSPIEPTCCRRIAPSGTASRRTRTRAAEDDRQRRGARPGRAGARSAARSASVPDQLRAAPTGCRSRRGAGARGSRRTARPSGGRCRAGDWRARSGESVRCCADRVDERRRLARDAPRRATKVSVIIVTSVNIAAASRRTKKDDEPHSSAYGDHGSSARRTPSESWFSETTVSRIATVGMTVCQGVYDAAVVGAGREDRAPGGREHRAPGRGRGLDADADEADPDLEQDVRPRSRSPPTRAGPARDAARGAGG